MNQRDEATAAAAAARTLRPMAGDPWWSYYGADARFINQWRDELRGMLP